jgi:hypothetical protein
MGGRGLGSFGLWYGSAMGSCLHGDDHSGSMKSEDFVDYLGDC